MPDSSPHQSLWKDVTDILRVITCINVQYTSHINGVLVHPMGQADLNMQGVKHSLNLWEISAQTEAAVYCTAALSV